MFGLFEQVALHVCPIFCIYAGGKPNCLKIHETIFLYTGGLNTFATVEDNPRCCPALLLSAKQGNNSYHFYVVLGIAWPKD